jgi:hypothetical protein
MPIGNSTRLLTIVDREFRQLVEKPEPIVPTRKFKPIKINAARFDQSWDRKRGAAARLMAVLVREDDASLERRVCESALAAKTYAGAAAWLQRESAYLRRIAKLLDTAGGRLVAVLSRCDNGARSEPGA